MCRLLAGEWNKPGYLPELFSMDYPAHCTCTHIWIYRQSLAVGLMLVGWKCFSDCFEQRSSGSEPKQHNCGHKRHNKELKTGLKLRRARGNCRWFRRQLSEGSSMWVNPLTDELSVLKWKSHLDKIKTAQFGLGAKLPLALCVRVIQLPGKLFGVLVLTDLLRLVHQTGCLGCSGEHSKPPVCQKESHSNSLANVKVFLHLHAALRPTQGSGWGTVDCRWTRRRPRCFQPEWET